MTQSLDDAYKAIMTVADRGIGRNCGKPPEEISLNFFKNTIFVDAELARENIGSPEFENFLLTIRPAEKYFQDSSIYKNFSSIFNDVATFVRPYVDSITAEVTVIGLDNEPQGFSPSLPSSTVGWILISYAQEFVAVHDFQYSGPLKCRDLFSVLDIGRLPVGLDQRPYESALMIY